MWWWRRLAGGGGGIGRAEGGGGRAAVVVVEVRLREGDLVVVWRGLRLWSADAVGGAAFR